MDVEKLRCAIRLQLLILFLGSILIICLYIIPSLMAGTHFNEPNLVAGRMVSRTSVEEDWIPQSFPVWSRGLARTCCDIFPYSFAPSKRHSERAETLMVSRELARKVPGLASYQVCKRGKMLDGPLCPLNFTAQTHDYRVLMDPAVMAVERPISVYVPSNYANFKQFLKAFQTLPQHARIVLVSGQEDTGVPMEIWNRASRKYMSMRKPPMSLEKFLSDKRLVRWFTQNFDLNPKCNLHWFNSARYGFRGCKNKTIARLSAGVNPMDTKVTAWPIGLDLHSLVSHPPPWPGCCPGDTLFTS
jgi:hypothetical protein